MKLIKNDGGRKKAGFKGSTGDCVTRAIAIATGKPYREVYDEINELAKEEKLSPKMRGSSSSRTGVHKKLQRQYMAKLGWVYTPTMKIGSGCKVHLKAEELPMGRLIVQVSKHLVAVIDGVMHDTFDPSREGTRCVYGYYTKGEGR